MLKGVFLFYNVYKCDCLWVVLCFCRYVSVTVYLSTSVCMRVCICVSTCLPVSVFICLCMSECLCLALSVCVRVCIGSLCESFYLSLPMSVYLSFHISLPVFLPVSVCVCLSVCFPPSESSCPSICVLLGWYDWRTKSSHLGTGCFASAAVLWMLTTNDERKMETMMMTMLKQ